MRALQVLAGVVMACAATPVIAQSAYDGCSCVTKVTSGTSNLGKVVSSSGEVLVNSTRAAPGHKLNSGSEIITGRGQATMMVGTSCNTVVGPNTIVSINQPEGPLGKLCVRTSAVQEGVSTQENGGFGLWPFLVIGGAAGASELLDDDDDDDDDDRPPASP